MTETTQPEPSPRPEPSPTEVRGGSRPARPDPARPDPARPDRGRSVPAYRDGNVLRWFTAYAASMVGDGVYFLALGWAAQRVTGAAGVGLVLAVSSVPRALLMLGGGVIADRYGSRGVVLGSDAVRCVVVLAVAAVLALGTPGLWLLIAVGLVFGAVDALFLPAVGALPPRIADRDQLGRVQGMSMLGIRVGSAAGPPLGGLAMAYGGAPGAFATAGGLFALSLGLLVTVRMRPLPAAPAHGTAHSAAPSTAPRALGDGLRYIRRDPLIGRLVAGGTLIELALMGPLNVGLVLLAAERGWGASGTGWLVSAFGLGAGASALLLTARGRMPRAGLSQGAAATAACLGVGATGTVPSLVGALVVAAVAGCASGIAGGVSRALVQTHADPRLLGRVTSVMGLGALGLAPMSYPVFGAASAVWGAGPVFVVCGMLGLCGVLVNLTSPAVRHAELPELPHPARRGDPPGTG